MKTRAAVLQAIGRPRPYAKSRPLVVEELELDPPGPGEVLVEIKAAGLCHSDLSVINGDRPRPTPMALGHEAAGVVRELGPDVSDFAPGDHVVLVFVPSCGRCGPCMEGRPALCEPGAAANAAGNLLSGTRKLRRADGPVHHHMGVSAFAERAVVSRNSCVRIDSDLPLEEAALFGCAVLTGVGAVVNTARVMPGQSVAVIGLGGVGLNAVLGARLAGARRIVALDLVAEKLALARELGATDAFDAGDADCARAVRAATAGGVDVAFEMAGSVKAMALAWQVTRRGGATVTAGLPHPDHRFELPQVALVGEERTVRGSYIGSCVPIRDVPRYVELYRQGRLAVDRLLSERVGLDELNEAFDRLATGRTIRQVLVL
jgi:alcohol dehydrogenase